jgi:hypothetical protein
MPQANVIDASADGTVPRISDMEQYNNDRQARYQQKKTKDDGKGEDEGNVLGTSGEAQPSLARDGHNLKEADLEKYAEIDKNAMAGYDDYDNIIKDYNWFIDSMQEEKYTKATKYNQPEKQINMRGDELKVYNKLMKVGTDDTYKNDASRIQRTTGLSNILARKNNIIEFVQRKQQDPKTPLPTGDSNDDKKHSGSMLELLNTQSGAVAAPLANELRFG